MQSTTWSMPESTREGNANQSATELLIIGSTASNYLDFIHLVSTVLIFTYY